MKDKTINALITTSQALSITSQLLAIGIEVGIIVGGYYIFRQVKKELSEEEPVPQNVVAVVQAPEQPPTFKQRWDKAKKVIKAMTT